MVTASIVSHNHGAMVDNLICDLRACPQIERIILIRNVVERTTHVSDNRLVVKTNKSPRGYGANQNAAFADSTTRFFCVINPDVRLVDNPFPALLACMQNERLAGSAPVITTRDGRSEDSARRFPTAFSLLTKAAGLSDGTYAASTKKENPDWLAGMFLLLRSSAFRKVNGFDEGYYLYYEDVDLCWRLRREGYAFRQVQEVTAFHDARRASRRDWRHARWHLASMARFLVRSAMP